MDQTVQIYPDTAPKFLTPHKICVLILIQIYCTSSFNPDYRNKLALLLLKKIQDDHECSEPIFSDFLSIFERIMDSTHQDSVADLLKVKASDVAQVGSLYDFLNVELNGLFEPENIQDPSDSRTYLVKNSIMGSYVYKAKIETMKLMFDDYTKLYRAFLDYVGPVLAPEVFPHPEGHVKTALPAYDAERLIDKQLDLLDEGASFEPLNLQQQLNAIAQNVPEAYKVSLATSLNATNIGEYQVAVDQLHRFIDLCAGNNPENKVLPYAMMKLALLHHKFNHKEKAMAALNGCIDRALIDKDATCLNYAVNLMYLFQGKDMTDRKQKMLLDDLADRTKELGLADMRSQSYVIAAEHAMTKHHSPVEAFESLFRSDIINNDRHLDNQQAISHLEQASIWNKLGNDALASLYSQLVLIQNGEKLPAEDRVVLISDLASQALSRGNYDDAVLVLQKGLKSSLGSSNAVSQLTQSLSNVLLEKYSHREDLASLKSLLTTFRAISQNDKTSDYEFRLHLAAYHHLSGQSTKAYDILCDTLHDITNNYPQHENYCIKNLHKLADIHMDSNSPISALPVLFISISLCKKYCLNMLLWISITKLADVLVSLRLVGEATDLVESVVPEALANASVDVIGQVHLVYAKCILASAKTLDTRKGDSEVSDDAEGSQEFEVDRITLQKALSPLSKAAAAFRQVTSYQQLLDTLYLQARIHDSLGCVQERDMVCKEFRMIQEKVWKSRSRKHVNAEVASIGV
ncbi:anaphase-promoting complex subunit 5-domain-containing protein [Paraphysoderma sedebokerense]|nr:anaphase-promoting complex subunit 5-domain-containing protein [Paraphysoderma sedebokerense]